MNGLYLPGGMLIVGRCWQCRQSFTYDPYNVPTVYLGPTGEPVRRAADREQAQREPLCRSCVWQIEQDRAGLGLPPAFAGCQLVIAR